MFGVNSYCFTCFCYFSATQDVLLLNHITLEICHRPQTSRRYIWIPQQHTHETPEMFLFGLFRPSNLRCFTYSHEQLEFKQRRVLQYHGLGFLRLATESKRITHKTN